MFKTGIEIGCDFDKTPQLEWIVQTDDFLDLPFDCQVLYFHLLAHSDCGFIIHSPKAIMRMIGCNEQCKQVLKDKCFIEEDAFGIVKILTSWGKD